MTEKQAQIVYDYFNNQTQKLDSKNAD